MKSKAIGLRIPVSLWEQVTEFGCENFPKPDSERDFDITSTLLELIARGLGNDNVEQVDRQTVEQTVEEIVQQNVEQLVKQQLDDRLDNLLNKEEFNSQLNNLLSKEEFNTAIDSLRKEFEPLMGKYPA